MHLLAKLVLSISLFAVPVGLLVGQAAKQQKLADLLRFAKPDRSMIPGAAGIAITGVMLSAGGKSYPALSPLQIMFLIGFFTEAALIAYATYRLSIRRAQP